MDDFVLIEYEIFDQESEKRRRKRILAGPSESDPSTLNVYTMHRINGFWSTGKEKNAKEEVKIEEDVFNELNKSLEKVRYRTMTIETLQFLKCDLSERLSYLFETSNDPILQTARII